MIGILCKTFNLTYIHHINFINKIWNYRNHKRLNSPLVMTIPMMMKLYYFCDGLRISTHTYKERLIEMRYIETNSGVNLIKFIYVKPTRKSAVVIIAFCGDCNKTIYFLRFANLS